jgi:hypothetical protein
MPDLPQNITNPDLSLRRSWATAIQTINALSRTDTLANRPATPALDHIFFTTTDTKRTYVGVNGVWQPVGGSVAGSYTAADATPSVLGGVTRLTLTNAAPTNITTFDDGQEDQIVILLFTDANTTLVDGATLQLAGGANFVGSANDILTITLIGGVWYEIGRSVN